MIMQKTTICTVVTLSKAVPLSPGQLTAVENSAEVRLNGGIGTRGVTSEHMCHELAINVGKAPLLIMLAQTCWFRLDAST